MYAKPLLIFSYDYRVRSILGYSHVPKETLKHTPLMSAASEIQVKRIQREELRIFPGEMLRPPRIILLDGSGAITLDVISWLSTQNIPLFQLDYRGQGS
jgi:hypothetical protein